MSLVSNNTSKQQVPDLQIVEEFQKDSNEASIKSLNERVTRSASKSKVSNKGFRRGLDTREISVTGEQAPNEDSPHPHLLLQNKVESFTQKRIKIMGDIRQKHEDRNGAYRVKEVQAEAERRFEKKDCALSLIVKRAHHEKKSVKIHKLFGDGGQKKAWRFSSRQALLLPNYDTSPCTTIETTNAFAASWQNSVQEEVRVSSFLKKHSMMSCRSQEVRVFFDENSAFIPAYICDSFEHLKEAGIFIIEGKSDTSGTWLKRDGSKIFQSSTDRMEEGYWDDVFKPLLGDIAKIVTYGIPAEGDSFNMAIVKNQDSDSSAAQYHVRYFGLDFSVKGEHHITPLRKVALSREEAEEKVSSLLSTYISRVMEIEFHKTEEQYGALKDALVEKYKASILEGLTITSA